MIKFKFLEHKADAKFQAFGNSIGEVFKNSALALQKIMTKGAKIKPKIKKNFVVESENKEKMLYCFLEEFLYLFDAENFIFSKVKLKLFNETRLEVEILGDKASNYNFLNDVKAVTYNQMFVKKQGNKFITQVVLDV